LAPTMEYLKGSCTPVAFANGNVAAYNRRMAARRLNEPFEPMTLGNMRQHAGQRRGVARRVMLALSPSDGPKRRAVAGSCRPKCRDAHQRAFYARVLSRRKETNEHRVWSRL
jgi:hypothetical protein